MTILLPALALAFAAFCVWLTVRIVNRRERWAKWTLTAVIGTPVLHVASFGPACWTVEKYYLDFQLVAGIYRPLMLAACQSEKLSNWLFSYASFCGSDSLSFWLSASAKWDI